MIDMPFSEESALLNLDALLGRAVLLSLLLRQGCQGGGKNRAADGMGRLPKCAVTKWSQQLPLDVIGVFGYGCNHDQTHQLAKMDDMDVLQFASCYIHLHPITSHIFPCIAAEARKLKRSTWESLG